MTAASYRSPQPLGRGAAAATQTRAGTVVLPGRATDEAQSITAPPRSQLQQSWDSFRAHRAAFISLYPLLLMSDYRASPDWQTQITNLRLSNAAWTDDNGPKFNTVFSAGTSRSDWYAGYHADSLGSHTGDVTTFPSLMALSAATAPGSVPTAPAVARRTL